MAIMSKAMLRRITPFLMVACLMFPWRNVAAALDISTTPLFLSAAIEPNVIMTLDDSGSMCWGFAPGASSYNSDNRGPFTTPALFAGYGNALYYNPLVRYKSPRNEDGNPKYSTSFSAAYSNGFRPGNGFVDLGLGYNAPTGSYCNTTIRNTFHYQCDANFGSTNVLNCSTQYVSDAPVARSCSNTSFYRNSYSSTCGITYRKSAGKFYVGANNCADTSMSPFQGMKAGDTICVGGVGLSCTGGTKYTLYSNGSSSAVEIRVVEPVTTNSTPQNLDFSWNNGPDTIVCNQNGFFGNSSLVAGSTIMVNGGSNTGVYTLNASPYSFNKTIAVNERVTPNTGVQANFSWGGGGGNIIRVSDCGSAPFQGVTVGSTIVVSQSASNNGTYTVDAMPNPTELVVGTTLVNETDSSSRFTWTVPGNTVTASNCVDLDSSNEPDSTPFTGLTSGRSITISNSGANNGTYLLSQNPTNNGSTLTVTSNFPANSITTGAQFYWTTSGQAAYYHAYFGDLDSAGIAGYTSPPTDCSSLRNDADCYIQVTVGSATDLTFSGFAAAADSKQNFANWYSFYRTRALSVMSGATNAVSSFGDQEVRLAWQSINDCTAFGTCDGIQNTMYPLTGSSTSGHRKRFHDWLEGFSPSGSTPLRSAMQRAGNYYTQSGLNGPYVKVPGEDDSVYDFDGTTTELSCRKNFHILFTDGYWNQDTDFSIGGNVDGADVTSLPDSTGEFDAPKSPFSDNNSNNLADIAFYYWSTDLRVNLPNSIPPYKPDSSLTDSYWNPKNDPATWQHMVNFTIGLGLSEALGSDWGGSTYAGAYADYLTGKASWPSTGSNSAGNVYDLWHAALNSRGQFFSVDSSDAVDAAFRDIVDAIREGTPSSASVAANSTSIQTDTLVYQATFDGNDWSGHLKAIEILSGGQVGTVQWDVATRLPSHNLRDIFTFNSVDGKGEIFSAADCSKLAANQQTSLSGCSADLINYLRGDQTKEIRFSTPSVPTSFRNRITTVMGDIINSDPAYVYGDNYGYGSAYELTADERSTYASFLVSKTASGSVPVVYVGSGDGMVHAFNAKRLVADGGGSELFSFVPAGVYENLASLADPDYKHQYFVDGSPSAGDAYIDGNWKTYLVGGLNGGGRSIYALDISAPSGFSKDNVKWEFFDNDATDGADLGLTYSRPQIARLTNGTWVAIFGNGYNSTSGKASLYIIDLKTGGAELMKVIDTSSLDTNTTADNGLSTPALNIVGGVVTAAYAGDLHGNLWKFDLLDHDPTKWEATRLFAASYGGTPQPITAPPVIGPNSVGSVLIYFGTGSYLTEDDKKDKDVQSFYAIWDDPNSTGGGTTPTVSKLDLQQQYITRDTSLTTSTDDKEFGEEVRETTISNTSYATQKGWFIDLLPYTESGGTYTPGTPEGERVRSIPLLRDGRVIFVTITPEPDPCQSGGSSWLMELVAESGARTLVSSFDFNKDNSFNDDDLLSSGKTASGILLSGLGIATSPTWLVRDSGSAVKIITGSSGATTSTPNKYSGSIGGERIYWEEIR